VGTEKALRVLQPRKSATSYLPTNIEVAPADGLLTKEDVSSMEIIFSVILIKSDPMI
jgi:hypothetical protein